MALLAKEAERRRSASALATYVARSVVIKMSGLPALARYAWGTCSGARAEAVTEVIELDLCPAAGWRRRHRRWARQKARRDKVKRSRLEARRRWERRVRALGDEADDRGFWPVECILAVRRPERRWGRQLEVLVRWAGGGHEDSWESLAPWRFTPDQHLLARRMEDERYGRPETTLVFRGWRSSARLGVQAGGKRRVVVEGDEGRYVRARAGPRRIAESDSEDSEAEVES